MEVRVHNIKVLTVKMGIGEFHKVRKQSKHGLLLTQKKTRWSFYWLQIWAWPSQDPLLISSKMMAKMMAVLGPGK